MNLVKESIHFERGEDPKQSMEIGMFKDTPLPKITSFIKDQYANPKEVDYYRIFAGFYWDSIEIIFQLLELALKKEFPNIKFTRNKKFSILGETPDGMNIIFNPTENKDSFYVLFEGPLINGYRIRDNSRPQRDFKSIEEVIRKKAKKWDITI